MANVNKNHGFDKCIGFDEIAMLALRRALDINEDGLTTVNIRISRKQIDVWFHRGPDLFAAYYTHGSIISGSGTLQDLDDAFLKYERKELVHA